MPIIKPVSIHETPKRLIKYILNPEKNKDMKFATGISCHEECSRAYLDFKEVFEKYALKNFHRRNLSSAAGGRIKNDVLIFHYIQSFKPGECSAELAHKIGVQWAKRVFGNNRPVLVSTHDDRSHIHNHFAVSVFDNEGKRWYSNKKSLERCRKISDELAKEYGLSVIDEPKYKANQRYGDWIARKNGVSWKEKIADEIDRLVADKNISSVDDLIEALRSKGYEVNYRKYLSVKPPKGKHFVRTFRLGDGYSLEKIIYRIEHKDMEMTAVEIEKYCGIQREYAIALREMQLMVYRRQENYIGAGYDELMKNSELLCFVYEHGIKSEEQFRDYVNVTDEKYKDALRKQNEIEQKIAFEEKMISECPRFLELWNKKKLTPKESDELGKYQVLIDYKMYELGAMDRHRSRLSELKSQLAVIDGDKEKLEVQRKTVADNYNYYLSQMRNDIGRILERKYAEQAQLQRERQMQFQGEERNKETAHRYEPR